MSKDALDSEGVVTLTNSIEDLEKTPQEYEDTKTQGLQKFEDLEKAPTHYAGEGTTESPYVVKFYEGDIENPLNWPAKKRWIITVITSLSTLCVALGSSIYAGGLEPMVIYFDTSEELILGGLSLYVLGFASGPLAWGPLGETLGRKNAFIVSFLPFVLITFGTSGAKTSAGLLIMRFFTGFFGASPLVNSGATIADIFNNRDRALAMSVFALSPFLGPCFGPIVGGYIGQYSTWQVIFFVQGGFSALMFIITLLFVDETYGPVLLSRKALKLTTETGKVYISEFELKVGRLTLKDKLKSNMTRPFLMLLREPIVFLMSLYAAIIYGVLYMCFGAFPIVFQAGHGFSSGAGGLAFLGVGVGMVVGVIINYQENFRYVRQLDLNGGILPPEARLPMTCLGGVLVPVSLFWFAWTSGPQIHWIVPIIASAPFGTGMLLVFLSMTNYLVDTYTLYAASVLAGNAVLRSMFGAAFPLFTIALFEKLGTQWALSLFAFLSLACVPIPFLFMRYGAFIRRHSSFAPGHPPASTVLSKIPTKHELDLEDQINMGDLRQAEMSQEK